MRYFPSFNKGKLDQLNKAKNDLVGLGVNLDDYFITGANKQRVLRRRNTDELVAGPYETVTQCWQHLLVTITKEKRE